MIAWCIIVYFLYSDEYTLSRWMPRKPLQKTFSSFLSAHIQRINKPGWVQWCYFFTFSVERVAKVGTRAFSLLPAALFCQISTFDTTQYPYFVGGTSHKIFRADISAMLCFGGSSAPRSRNQQAPRTRRARRPVVKKSRKCFVNRLRRRRLFNGNVRFLKLL